MEYIVTSIPKDLRTERCELCSLARVKAGLTLLESLNGEFTVVPMDGSLPLRYVCHIDMPELIRAMDTLLSQTEQRGPTEQVDAPY